MFDEIVPALQTSLPHRAKTDRLLKFHKSCHVLRWTVHLGDCFDVVEMVVQSLPNKFLETIQFVFLISM